MSQMDQNQNLTHSCSLLDVDNSMIKIMLSALREHPAAEGLNEESMVAICREAIQLGTINDSEWLMQKIQILEQKTIKEESEWPSNQSSTENKDQEPVTSDEDKESLKTKEKKYLEISVSQKASFACMEELGPILEEHHGWIEQVVNPKSTIQGGRANLSECNLQGYDLSGVDLRGANLREANLQECNLFKANLSTANLTGANLKGANLDQAKLKRCQLEHADFTDASLKETDLRFSSLKGARYTEEQLQEAIT